MFDIIKKKGGINKYRVGDVVISGDSLFRIFHLDIRNLCHRNLCHRNLCHRKRLQLRW